MPYKDIEKRRALNRDWYARNKERTYQRNVQTRARLASWYNALKEAKPCTDCDTKYASYVMHWDHMPGYVKVAPVVSILWGTWSKEAVLAEIAKCELVCANCHAERTHQRTMRSGLKER